MLRGAAPRRSPESFDPLHGRSRSNLVEKPHRTLGGGASNERNDGDGTFFSSPQLMDGAKSRLGTPARGNRPGGTNTDEGDPPGSGSGPIHRRTTSGTPPERSATSEAGGR